MYQYSYNDLQVEDYNQLRVSVGWLAFPTKQAELAAQRCLTSLVVRDESQVIAMGRLIGDGIYYLIVDVVVSPTYQAQGIGKKIMRLLIEQVYLDMIGERASIQLIAAQGKEEFYQKLGFQKISNECSGHAMRMVLNK